MLGKLIANVFTTTLPWAEAMGAAMTELRLTQKVTELGQL